jgi:exosortase
MTETAAASATPPAAAPAASSATAVPAAAGKPALSAAARPSLSAGAPAAVGWAGLAVASAALAWLLKDAWLALEEYSHGFFVIAFAAFVAWYNSSDFRAAPRRPTALGVPLVLLGSLAFCAGWMLAVPLGGRPAILWVMYAGLMSTAVGWIASTHGLPRLWTVAFPLAVTALAVPVPGRLLGSLQEVLKTVMTKASTLGLKICGVAVGLNGHILNLPGGPLEVAGACSGVRSLGAMFFFAIVVAWFLGLSAFQWLLLLLATVPIVLAANVFRIVATGLLQEYVGRDYTQGTAHEMLGLSVLLISAVAILVIASRFKVAPAGAAPGKTGGDAEDSLPSGGIATLCGGLLGLAAAACVLGVVVRAPAVRAAHLKNLPTELSVWQGLDMEPPPGVIESLQPDEYVCRVYSKPGDRRAIRLTVMFFNSDNTFRDAHDMDVCRASTGFELQEARAAEIRPRFASAPFRVWLRRYTQSGLNERYFYWTNLGRLVVDPSNTSPADTLGLLPAIAANPVNPTAKLFVMVTGLVGTEPESDLKLLEEFTADITAELYYRNPWAIPAGVRMEFPPGTPPAPSND